MRRLREESHSGIQGQGGRAALRGDKTLVPLVQQFNAHANQITQWKTQWLDLAKDSV